MEGEWRERQSPERETGEIAQRATIKRERERERENKKGEKRDIYIYIYRERERERDWIELVGM